MGTTNKFKTDFKYYKQKCPPPDYAEVWDFSNLKEDAALKRIKAVQSGTAAEYCEETYVAGLMKPPSEWDIYELLDKPGLIFIRNPFTTAGQRYWIYRCLRDFTKRPNRLNIDAHDILDKSQDWWDYCQGKEEENLSLKKKLRWVTMGYHHNWDTKVYSENMRDPFPGDLADLSRFVGRIIGLQEDFSAEAAIVNFYHFDSTLSGHTDHSEMNMSAPLFSFSFGQTAIFLLGGISLDITPTPMFIKSGDIVIMSGYSRKCYHGIPKIVPAQDLPWGSQPFSPVKCEDGMSDNEKKGTQDFPDPPCKQAKIITKNVESYEISKHPRLEVDKLLNNLSSEECWKPFETYIEQSRINMNVRQVLFKGDETLSNKMK